MDTEEAIELGILLLDTAILLVAIVLILVFETTRDVIFQLSLNSVIFLGNILQADPQNGYVYRRFKASASGLDPEGEADNA